MISLLSIVLNRRRYLATFGISLESGCIGSDNGSSPSSENDSDEEASHDTVTNERTDAGTTERDNPVEDDSDETDLPIPTVGVVYFPFNGDKWA